MSKFNVGDEVVVTKLTDFAGLECEEAHQLWGEAIGHKAVVFAVESGDSYVLDPVKRTQHGFLQTFYEDELDLVKRYTP